jgi:hypothetical protein
MKSIDILVVEDNDDVILIREAFAEERLADHIAVRDGEDAMAYLRGQGASADTALPTVHR